MSATSRKASSVPEWLITRAPYDVAMLITDRIAPGTRADIRRRVATDHRAGASDAEPIPQHLERQGRSLVVVPPQDIDHLPVRADQSFLGSRRLLHDRRERFREAT